MYKLTAEQVVERLRLKPLPGEGGFYRETYRAQTFLPEGRSVSTAIYYLITPHAGSRIHRVDADEMFHFYAGDPAEIIMLSAEGPKQQLRLGPNLDDGEYPQVLVPAGVWQGLRVVEGGQWSLLGTTVAPGFTFDGFEMADPDQLIERFPECRADIRRFG
jgi:uncharacterized protein